MALICVLSVSGCSNLDVMEGASAPAAKTPAKVQQVNRELAAAAAVVEKPTASHGLLTLDKAIEEALAANPELDQVRHRIEAASQQVKEADALFYPRLVFNENYGITNLPGTAFMYILNQRRFQQGLDFNNPGVVQDFETQIGAQMPLFVGGANWYGRKAAWSRQHAVAAEYAAARNQLVAKVCETYFKWLEALTFIHVAERAYESAKVSQQLGAERVRAQTALPSDLTRLEVRTAEAHSNLIAAKIAASRLQAAIEWLIARPVQPDEIPQPVVELRRPTRQEASGSQKELVDQALKYRPEMAAAAYLIRAAQQRLLASRSGFLPKINANAFYEWDNENLGNLGSSHGIGAQEGTLPPGGWFVGVSLTWPLFEGGASLARMREAEADLEQMKAHGRQVALNIALQVRQASLGVKEAMEQVRVSLVQRRLADQALSQTQRLYRDQAATIDALLQAEVAANRAAVSYTTALFNIKIAQTVLMQSIGSFTDWTQSHT